MNNKLPKYHDALFVATSSSTVKKDYHLPLAEYRLLLKLIHYSTNENDITWSSENIGKHLLTSPTSIDKSIERLKRKRYISVETTSISRLVKKRTINIKWERIEEINKIYQELETVDLSDENNKVEQDTIPTEIVSEIDEKQPKKEKEMIYLSKEELNWDNEELLDSSENEIEVVDDLYSTETFVSYNREWKVKKIHLDYFNKNKSRIGILSVLGKQTDQFGFNYELDRLCKEDENKKMLFAEFNK